MIIYNLKIYNDDIVEIDELYATKIKVRNRIKEIERKFLNEPLPKGDIKIIPIKVR